MSIKLKSIIKYILITCLMILVFIGLLYTSMLIQNENMEQNVIESEKILEKKGNLEEAGRTLLDNWTDAVMINTAYSVDSAKPFESLIFDRRSYNPDKELILDEEKNDDENPIQDLQESIEGKNTKYYQYGRYWHGYLIFLRPLLCFFNYEIIRIILVAIINILSLILIYLVFKKVDKIIAVIFTILLVYASFHVLGMSITYFSVIAISIIFSIYIIQKQKISPISFFIVGGLTSFFDLLSAPILTLGIPLIIHLLINKEKCTYKKMLIMCVNWGIGYGLIWISKWIISDLVYNSNLIADGINQTIQRTGNKVGEKNINYIDVIKKNFEFYKKMIKENIIILVITMIGFKHWPNKQDLKYILIATMPFAWYFVTQNHSYIHAKFTHRILFITMLALSVLTYRIIKEKVEKIEEIKIKEAKKERSE